MPAEERIGYIEDVADKKLAETLLAHFEADMTESRKLLDDTEARKISLEPSGADLTTRALLYSARLTAVRGYNLQLALKRTANMLTRGLCTHGKKLVEASEASTKAARDIGSYTRTLCIVTGGLVLASVAQLVAAIWK